jgi:hypothetical protein
MDRLGSLSAPAIGPTRRLYLRGWRHGRGRRNEIFIFSLPSGNTLTPKLIILSSSPFLMQAITRASYGKTDFSFTTNWLATTQPVIPS